MSQNRDVDDVADAYVKDLAALDPLIATYIGVPGHDHEMPDLSPDGTAAVRGLATAALADLEAADARTPDQEVARDAMADQLRNELAYHDARLGSQLNVIDSATQQVREVFDLMPTETAEHWGTIAKRMAAVPAALAGYRQTMLADADAGWPPSQRQVTEVIKQCERTASGFFHELVASSSDHTLTGGLRDDLDAAAAAASTAYGEFAGFLRDTLGPRARERDAVGPDKYAVASRLFLGDAIDVDETYAWGVEELARIDAEMADVAGKIKPGGTVADAAAALDADSHRTLTGTEALQVWMQTLSDTTLAAMNGVHFDIPEPIRRLECRIAPTKDGGIYYTAPSDDLSRPGRMWWSVPEGVTEFSTWRETTTVFHEGVPGHHLQIAQMVYNREKLNSWQRLLGGTSGFAEGWALYAERLMQGLGFLDDVGDHLGMLDGQAFRAARVVVDIGLHLDKEIPASIVTSDGLPAGTWTPESAFTFLRHHCLMPDEFLRFELNRYLGWPGQAPSYKVGERIWLEAREDARARLGDRFDLKEFHRVALDLGGMGLGPLKQAIATRLS